MGTKTFFLLFIGAVALWPATDAKAEGVCSDIPVATDGGLPMRFRERREPRAIYVLLDVKRVGRDLIETLVRRDGPCEGNQPVAIRFPSGEVVPADTTYTRRLFDCSDWPFRGDTRGQTIASHDNLAYVKRANQTATGI